MATCHMLFLKNLLSVHNVFWKWRGYNTGFWNVKNEFLLQMHANYKDMVFVKGFHDKTGLLYENMMSYTQVLNQEQIFIKNGR